MTPPRPPPGWHLWWLSYAVPGQPLGVVLMEGTSAVHAAIRSRQQGLAPGGEVCGWRVPLRELERCWALRHRLLSRADLGVLAAPYEPDADTQGQGNP